MTPRYLHPRPWRWDRALDKCKGFVFVRVIDHWKLGWLRFFSSTYNLVEYQGAALSFSNPLFSYSLLSHLYLLLLYHLFSSFALFCIFPLFSICLALLTSVYPWCHHFMFTGCVYLPLISVTSASLPPSCLLSCLLTFLTSVPPSPPSLSSLVLRMMWPLALHIVNYWGETQHLSAAQKITGPLSASVSLSSYPRSPLYWCLSFPNVDLWLQIKSQVSEGNMRFSFSPLFWS